MNVLKLKNSVKAIFVEFKTRFNRFHRKKIIHKLVLPFHFDFMFTQLIKKINPLCKQPELITLNSNIHKILQKISTTISIGYL